MKFFHWFCCVALTAATASASTISFNSYSSTGPVYDNWTQSTNVVSLGGLDFTGDPSAFTLVYDGSSFEPSNSNGNQTLAYGYGSDSAPLTISLTGGGAFTLNGFDLTLSWFDSNPSEAISVVANYAGGGSATDVLSVGQGFQTYGLSFVNVDSVTVGGDPNGFWMMNNIEYNDPVATTPEPGSLSLIFMGLLALGGKLRRRRTNC